MKHQKTAAQAEPSTRHSVPPPRFVRAEVRAGLAAMRPASVDCVVTSPPYFWQRDYGFPEQIGHEPTIAGYVSALRDVFADVRRVLRTDGVLFLNLGDTYYSAKGRPHGKDDKHRGRLLSRQVLRAVDGPGLRLPRKSLIGIPWRVALALQDDGWTLRSDIVWKRLGAMPDSSREGTSAVKHPRTRSRAQRSTRLDEHEPKETGDKTMIGLIRRAYARFLFWKWDLEYYAAIRRMRDCVHENTMFVDVGTPPHDCVEKCCDCWALRLPKLGGEWPTDELEWTPNTANPRHARPASPPNARTT